MEAIILAGGMGTRLKGVVDDVSKVMAPINKRPFLEYLLNHLKKYNVYRAIMSVGYKHDAIQKHFKDSFNGIKMEYIVEDEPLGTGGAIKKACKYLNNAYAYVVNGDTLFNIDLDEFIMFHRMKFADITVALCEMDDPQRYGTVEMNDGIINKFKEKGQKKPGLINGGVYLVEKSIFEMYNFPEKFSFEKELMEKYVDKLTIAGYAAWDYFIDIGVPEDLERAKNELRKFPY